jgi:hypothetical protein
VSLAIPRRRGPAALIAAWLVLATMPGAAAADDHFVSIIGCHFGGGEAIVEAGEPIVIRWGWLAKTRGLVVMTVGASDQTVTVGGEEIPNVDAFWGSPVAVNHPTLGRVWQAHWAYELDPLAEPGDSVVVTLDLTMTHPTLDLLTFEEDSHRPAIAPAGSYFGETIECRITAD